MRSITFNLTKEDGLLASFIASLQAYGVKFSVDKSENKVTITFE